MHRRRFRSRHSVAVSVESLLQAQGKCMYTLLRACISQLLQAPREFAPHGASHVALANSPPP